MARREKRLENKLVIEVKKNNNNEQSNSHKDKTDVRRLLKIEKRFESCASVAFVLQFYVQNAPRVS